MRGTTFARRGRLGSATWPGSRVRPTHDLVRVGLALALAATLAGAILLARSAGSGRAAVLPSARRPASSSSTCPRASPAPLRAGRGRRARPHRGEPAGGARHVLRRRLRAAAAELAAERAAAIRALLHSEPCPPRRADIRPEPVEPVQRRHQDLDRPRRRPERPPPRGRAARISRADERPQRLAERPDPLVNEAAAFRQAHVPIRIMPLNATPAERPDLHQLFGPNVFVEPQAFKKVGSSTSSRSPPLLPGHCSLSASSWSACLRRTSASTLVSSRSRPHEAHSPRTPARSLAVVLLALATVLVLFASDVRAWQAASRRATCASGPSAPTSGCGAPPPSFRATRPAPCSASTTRFPTGAPCSSTGSAKRVPSTGGQADLAATQVAAETQLQRLMTSGATAQERSNAANLLGVMTVTLRTTARRRRRRSLPPCATSSRL